MPRDDLAAFAARRRAITADRDPASRRAKILELLAPASSWAEVGMGLDLAVEFIDEPTDDECAALREVWERIADDASHDRLGLLRTGIVRLISRGPGGDDIGVLRAATDLYLWVEGTMDVAAEMRGLGLLGIAKVDETLARYIAARLIYDGDVPDQEPHLSAVRLLVGHGDMPLVLDWLDGDRGHHPADAVSEAEAALARSMPAALWSERAVTRLGDVRPVETLAAVDGIVDAENPRVELDGAVGEVVLRVVDVDLFRALAMTLAASRESAFQDVLMGLVDGVGVRLLDAYTDALALSRDARKDDVLGLVNVRARGGV